MRGTVSCLIVLTEIRTDTHCSARYAPRKYTVK